MKKAVRNIILRLKERYGFLFDEKSDVSFDEIIVKLIEESTDENKEIHGLQGRGAKFFKDYIHKELCLFESSEIINKFINTKIAFSSRKEECIEQLQILDSFFYSVHYILTDEMAYHLFIENEKINKIIQTIINDPYENEKIAVSENIMTLFDVYCERYSIENDFVTVKSNTSVDKKVKFPDYETLTSTEEKELFKKYSKNDENAKQELMMGNLNYVKYLCNLYNFYNLPQDDLFQEGVLGLIRSIEKFDLSLGSKFSTYAGQQIRSKIERYIAANITPFTTTSCYGMCLKKFYRSKINLEKQIQKPPTVNELAFYTNLPKDKVVEYEKMLDLFLIDEVNYNENTEDFISLVELKYDTHNLLINSDLTESEMTVVKEKFGFDKQKIKSFSQIGEQLGITRMYVKQKEDLAFLKLRNQEMISDLACYMSSEKIGMQNIESYWNEAYQKAYNDPFSYFATVYQEIAAKRKVKQ